MTPAEPFAQSRLQAENLIRQLAPARLQDAVIEKLAPAIALTATRKGDDAIAIGASKFGGAPDVPAGFVWPKRNPIPFGHLKGKETPLNFMAQLDLQELSKVDLESRLPASGVLSFFYANSEEGGWPWGKPGEEDGWRVFHFEGELERATVPTGDQEQKPIQTATISFHPYWSFSNDVYWESFGSYNSQEQSSWSELVEKLEPPSSHQMFGYPLPIQGDARDSAAEDLKRGEMDDWHLLLQINSDAELDFMWHDMGALFYLMHRDDLKARQWDKCWMVAQCG